MKFPSLPALLAVAVLANTSALAQAHGGVTHATAAPATNQLAQADAALRDLWLEHCFWVRNVVLATTAGNTAAAAAAEANVVRNAQQIANAMEVFYGKAAAENLFSLLAGHYGAVKQYLLAAVLQDRVQQDAARATMGENAGKLASFLAAANPNLPRDAVLGMLLAHGDHHILQIDQLRDKQYVDEAQTWMDMKSHMYAVADALAGALSQQFPDKFR